MEVFKDIVGYEGRYQVSNQGRVKSLARTSIDALGRTWSWNEKMLKPGIDRGGYHFVNLRDGHKGRSIRVHRLVAKTFIWNPENKPQVNHVDGLKDNNSAENLEWVTSKENIRHAWESGLSSPGNANINGNHQGEKVKLSKLTEKDVNYIRENSRHLGGAMTNVELAVKFRVNSATIRNVVIFETWKHVGEPQAINKGSTTSKTGFKYVSKYKSRFIGNFIYQKKKYGCGTHNTPEKAYEAVISKRKELGLD